VEAVGAERLAGLIDWDRAERDVYKAIIIVNSATMRFGQRRLLRQGWISKLQELHGTEYVRVLFAVSNNRQNHTLTAMLARELAEYNDMLLLPGDDYDPKRAVDKMRAIFHYVYGQFRFNHLLMTNDRSIINPWAFNDTVFRWPNAMLYAGVPIINEPLSSQDTIGGLSTYPAYVASGTIVLSSDLVTWIARAEEPLRMLSHPATTLGLWLLHWSNIEARQLHGVVLHGRFDVNDFQQNPQAYFLIASIGSDDLIMKLWVEIGQSAPQKVT
jgi:hypothetical protein